MAMSLHNPRRVAGAFVRIARDDTTHKETFRVGSQIFEVPYHCMPGILNNTQVILHLTQTGLPDRWEIPVRSLRKALGVEQEELDRYRLENGADALTAERLWQDTFFLPVLAHSTVVKMLNQPHAPTYESLLRYPCTPDSPQRNLDRRLIMSHPILGAYIYRIGRANAFLMLRNRYGLKSDVAEKVYDVLDLSVGWLPEFPYLSAYAINGEKIPFYVMDIIADAHQKTASLPDRIYAGVFWAVQDMVFKQRRIHFTPDKLKDHADTILKEFGKNFPTTTLGRQVSSGGFRMAIDQAWKDLVATEYVSEWITKSGQVLSSINRVKFAINHAGRRAATIATHPPMDPLVPILPLLQTLAQPPYALDATQLGVIEQLLTQQMTIITGGPGRGKTRLIAALTHALSQLNPAPSVWVVSPTARAAIRARQATLELAGQMPQSGLMLFTRFLTVHKALGATPTMDGNPNKTAFPDLVIVDEASMLDGILTDKLLEGVLTQHKRLVWVGDAAQLPPVGLGRILRNTLCLLQGQPGSTVQNLTHDYRRFLNPINPALERLQEATALHDHLSGDASYESATKEEKKARVQAKIQAAVDVLHTASTVTWNPKVTTSNLDSQIIRAVKAAKKQFPDADPLILTPYRYARSLNSTTLNETLHTLLTQSAGKGAQATAAGNVYVVGEPVIIKENAMYNQTNLPTQVYVANGTPGIIRAVNGNTLVVEVDNADDINLTSLIDLHVGGFHSMFDWGYVSTTHAAQGGQSPVIILIGTPADADKHPGYDTEWELHMFYTALSRIQDMAADKLGHVTILGELTFQSERPEPADRTFSNGWNTYMKNVAP